GRRHEQPAAAFGRVIVDVAALRQPLGDIGGGLAVILHDEQLNPDRLLLPPIAGEGPEHSEAGERPAVSRFARSYSEPRAYWRKNRCGYAGLRLALTFMSSSTGARAFPVLRPSPAALRSPPP